MTREEYIIQSEGPPDIWFDTGRPITDEIEAEMKYRVLAQCSPRNFRLIKRTIQDEVVG